MGVISLIYWLFLNGEYYVTSRLIDTDCGDILKSSYDYIVAGAGTAGCVVAARLSENPPNTVLVLEAGGIDESPAMQIPSLRFSSADDAFWYYETEPQEKALLSNERRVVLENVGRILGGTSSINAMAYFRGFGSEYDLWQRLGADGWSYKDVLPFFLKSEGTRIPEFRNSVFHNTCGPMAVTTTNMTPPITVWFQAAQELGIPEVDCNQRTPLGICRGQVTIRDGKRESTLTAFLKPAIGRQNLDVLMNALVTRVLISRRTNRTIGIEFLYRGRLRRIRARKEVVLSAGAYGTPKILLLSGIGPRKQLKRFRVPVRANLPVGENLQLQPEIVAKLFIDLPTLTAANFTDPDVLSQYIFRREGLFAEKTTTDASLVFQKTNDSTNPLPEYQLVLQEGVRFGLTGPPPQTPGGQNRFNMLFFLLHPKSRGTVRLRSRNATDFPRIDPRLLTVDDDTRDVAIGIQRLETFLSAPSLRAINARFEPEPLANCSHLPFRSFDYWFCFARFRVTSPSHPVGTCRMGNLKGISTVVDPTLRVKGIHGLRVADNSIMPEPAGLTYAAAIMIGEKAADLIKKTDQLLTIWGY